MCSLQIGGPTEGPAYILSMLSDTVRTEHRGIAKRYIVIPRRPSIVIACAEIFHIRGNKIDAWPIAHGILDTFITLWVEAILFYCLRI